MFGKTICVCSAILTAAAVGAAAGPKTRLAVVGLDHDHVWGILRDIQHVPDAELVAIADTHPDLIQKARKIVSPSVRFYSDDVKMLDEAKPDAAIVTTANDRHLAILRECAKRHISYSTEKPMAMTGAEAREMLRLARQAHIKLMVNYWNAWAAPTREIYRLVEAGEVGPVQKIIVQYGHQGPREIGVSKEFAAWLYDPAKNGGGALVDFGCYGAELSLWLKGRPTRVFAVTQKLKVEQHNRVDDDATIILEYPDGEAILEPSWNWPYSMGRTEVFGPKGSLLATNDQLFFRPAGSQEKTEGLDGKPMQLQPLPENMSNPVAYFVDCIRNNKPVTGPVAPELNVAVCEILDAARESIRTGHWVEMAK